MAKLADALDLGSSGIPPCRFKSCYQYQIPTDAYGIRGDLVLLASLLNRLKFACEFDKDRAAPDERFPANNRAI